jgi:hypothetical protein
MTSGVPSQPFDRVRDIVLYGHRHPPGMHRDGDPQRPGEKTAG